MTFTENRILRRRGFTLVELLVVITIIGILVSMLIPAIQSARESSRGATCKSNMRQIGLALQMYEQQKRKFPPAGQGIGTSQADLAEWGMLPWLLPYLEATNLYDLLDFAQDWNADDNEPYTKEISFGFARCPSAPAGRMAYSDYSPATRIDPDDISDLIDSGRVSDHRGSDGDKRWDGPLQWEYATSTASIKDDLSTTYLLFEDAGRPLFFQDGAETSCSGFGCPSGKWADEQQYFIINDHLNGRFINIHNRDEVYSFHPGGCNILFADGGVVFHSQTIEPEIFVSHFTRAGEDFAGDR